MKVMKLIFGLVVAGAFISNAQVVALEVKIKNDNIVNGIICKLKYKAGLEVTSALVAVGASAAWNVDKLSEVDSISVTHQGTNETITKTVGTTTSWKAWINPAGGKFEVVSNAS